MADRRGDGPWRRRRGGRDVGGRSGGGKRTPPPETTWAEAEYIIARKQAEDPMVIQLLDGETVRGVIEYYDRHMIKVVPPDAPGRFIWKKDIRFMHADVEAGAEDA